MFALWVLSDSSGSDNGYTQASNCDLADGRTRSLDLAAQRGQTLKNKLRNNFYCELRQKVFVDRL